MHARGYFCNENVGTFFQNNPMMTMQGSAVSDSVCFLLAEAKLSEESTLKEFVEVRVRANTYPEGTHINVISHLCVSPRYVFLRTHIPSDM